MEAPEKGKGVINEEQNLSLTWSSKSQQLVCKPGRYRVVFPPKEESLIN